VWTLRQVLKADSLLFCLSRFTLKNFGAIEAEIETVRETAARELKGYQQPESRDAVETPKSTCLPAPATAAPKITPDGINRDACDTI
jgi:hypothetical protein